MCIEKCMKPQPKTCCRLTVTNFVEDEARGKYKEITILHILCEALAMPSAKNNKKSNRQDLAELAELEPLLARFEKAAEACSNVRDLKPFEFLGHDLRVRLHQRQP